MCGIAGFIDLNKASDQKTLVRMTDALQHRGPDSAGYEIIRGQHAHIGLGHRRLAILDLSDTGHQPMRFQDLMIVFNGEVYNFKDIRAELEEAGYTFVSTSDTEVVLKAFDKWGPEAVKRFNGMFAFTISDLANNTTYIFRDRTGIKPLYYYQHNGLFLFGSELKALLAHQGFQKEINKDALALYLQYAYVPAPHSIFRKTYKLLPGHYLKIDTSSLQFTEIKYWDVVEAYNAPKLVITEQEAMEEAEALMTSAFKYRMVSDVPVGVFLSGGYDSSAVTAFLQKGRTERLKTFTIGFEDKAFDEARYAEEVANYLGTDHTSYYCTTREAMDIIPELAFYFDEPFGDQSAIPTLLVSRLARKDVTVALSADGGDETFAGYQKHQDIINNIARLSMIPANVQPILGSLLALISPSVSELGKRLKTRFEHNYYTLYKALQQGMSSCAFLKFNTSRVTPAKLSSVLRFPFSPVPTFFDSEHELLGHNDNLNRILAVDYKTFLVDDVLVKVDRATMAVSLEGRDPLLDHRIIEFAARLPSDLKLNGHNKKYLLKEIVHKYLPKRIMDRPKMGFDIPIIHWFRNELKYYFDKYLDEAYLEKQGIFQAKALINIKDNYLRGRNDYFDFLWNVLMFQMWYEQWMEQDTRPIHSTFDQNVKISKVRI